MAASTSNAATNSTGNTSAEKDDVTSDVTTSRDFLIVVLDLNPMWWGLHGVALDLSLTRCLDSVLAFCNMHLVMSPLNEVAILGVTPERTEFLYPVPPDQRREEGVEEERPSGSDGKYEVLDVMNEQVMFRAKELVGTCSSNRTDITVSGAITKALCLYNRRDRECNLATGRLSARILVIKAAEDNPSQYMALMNAVFTAQKLMIPIDACIFSVPEPPMETTASVRGTSAKPPPSRAHKGSSLLQQAADLTSGIYLCIPKPTGLLQYLISVFLPRVELRSSLILPSKVAGAGGSGVDFRAACFCHRRLVDVGYVCSVCLSIFCQFSPICTTCHAQFKLDVVTPAKKVKK